MNTTLKPNKNYNDNFCLTSKLKEVIPCQIQSHFSLGSSYFVQDFFTSFFLLKSKRTLVVSSLIGPNFLSGCGRGDLGSILSKK